LSSSFISAFVHLDTKSTGAPRGRPGPRQNGRRMIPCQRWQHADGSPPLGPDCARLDGFGEARDPPGADGGAEQAPPADAECRLRSPRGPRVAATEPKVPNDEQET
jgi:hypothetical protein